VGKGLEEIENRDRELREEGSGRIGLGIKRSRKRKYEIFCFGDSERSVRSWGWLRIWRNWVS
jgi:hypothetical protein